MIKKIDYCPLCGGKLELRIFGLTSFLVCIEDGNHRISLAERSKFHSGQITIEELKTIIEERKDKTLEESTLN